MSRAGHPAQQRPVVEALEAKLLYSADLGLAAFIPTAGEALVRQAWQAPSAAEAAAPTLSTAQGDVTAQQAGTELVFIDASVPDAEALTRDIQQQAAQGRAIEAIVIRSDEDGLDRITQTLKDRHDLSAVHLIGHGEAGDMHMGQSRLDNEALMQRAGDIAQWGAALTSDADILLYGCDVAQGSAGQTLVQGLAALTGADVAASDDLTGATVLGGDWTLEVQTGHIDAALAVSAGMQSQWDGVLLQATPSTQGTAVWAKGGDGAAQQNKWDGLTLGSQTNTASLSSTFTVMASAQSPTRDEAIVVGVDSAGAIRAERWDGTQWTAVSGSPLATGTANNRQGFAVSYEQTSGDAMLVWNDGTALRYSVFNGNTWSTAATIGAYSGAAPQQMHLASQPGGDQMALVLSDANADDYALIWDGSSWGHAVSLDTSGTTSADQLTTAVTYEARTGRAMVAYTKAGDANVYYRLYSGSAWTSEASVGSFSEAMTPASLTLASDPNSNRIALGWLSTGANAANQVSLDVWSGSAWGTRLVADSYTDATPGGTVALAFESNSGDLLAVYGGDASTVRYRTWTSSGGWSAQATGPSTGTPGATQLFADPYTDHIMLGVQAENGAISYTDWTGSAFGTTNTVTTASGSTQTSAFAWLWTSETASKTNTLVVGTSSAATGWNGVQNVSATEVLELADPHLSYGANTTNGSFTHLVNFGAMGASGVDDMVMVSRTVVLSGSIGVQRGDILFTTTNASTLVNADGSTVSVNNDDVVRFRPTVAGRYDKGTFTVLVQALGSSLLNISGGDVKGLALVEQTTTVAGVSLAAGTILFTQGSGTAAATIQYFVPANATVLNGLLLGTGASTLITGSDININQGITGLEVVTQTTPLKNVTLTAGQLLISLDQTDTTVGSNNLAVNQGDVAILSATSTTAATASILMRGSGVGISARTLDSLALSLDAKPVIGSNGGGATATIAVNENTTAVTTVTATDVDPGTTLTYAITGGADAARFTIDAATGVLQFVSAMNYEDPVDANGDNQYLVTVSASDGTYSATQALTVAIANVNEGPKITSNGGGGAVIVLVPSGTKAATTVQAYDPDAGDTLTYSVSGVSAASFTINASTGVLTFKSTTSYNNGNGNGNGYIVNVTATDAAGLSSTQQLIFSVQQGSSVANTAPVIDTNGGAASAAVTVVEQQTYVTTVHAANSNGYYENETITYAISGGADQALFQINAMTGKLEFKNAPLAAAPSDAGANNVYNVTVSATDGTYTDTQALAITVQAYDVPPVNTLPTNFAVNEDTATALTGLHIADTDAGTNNVTVTLSVDHGAITVLNNVSGGVTEVVYSTGANGARQVALTGTVAAINTTLAASNGVVYRADSNYTGTDTLTMVSDDLGHSGATRSPAQTTDTDTALITVAALPDAPVLASTAASLVYTENAAATAVDASLTLSDVDGGSYTSATVRITGGYVNGQDILAFTNQLGITGSWNAATGTLTLSGTTTISNYQSALRAVTYRNTSDNPDTSARTVTFSFGDGTGTGTATRGISVVAVNDLPVISGSGTALTYTENNAATSIDPAIVLSDVDSSTFAGAKVRITDHYVSGQDVLSFNSQFGINASWDATTGTLTLSGTASVANYQAALRSVTYRNSSDNPDTGARTISFSIDEGNGGSTFSRGVAVIATNDPPALATTTAPQRYTLGDPATAIDQALSLSDADNATLASATVQITGHYTSTEDQLGFVDQLGITGSWDAASGTLTLTGVSTVANYQTALRSVTYANSAGLPDTTARTVTFTVNDGGGPVSATRDVEVTLVNNPPTLSTTQGPVSYTENNAALAIDTGIALSDVDTTTFTLATVQITGHYASGEDVLALDASLAIPGIAASWDAGTGTLTINGSASTSDFESVLRAVTYANSSDDPDTQVRTVTFRVNDGAYYATATRDITVNALNDAPTLDATATSQHFTEDDNAVAIDPGLTLADVDTATFSGALVVITGHHVTGEDELGFTNQSGITGSWDAGTGTLTLSGTASLADYQAALRSVTYRDTSHTPDTTDRAVTFSLSDGQAPAVSATRVITLSSVDDAPTIATTGAPLAYREGDVPTAIDPGVSVGDDDSTQLAGATVQITGHHVASEDELAFTNQLGITGTWDAASGTLSLSGNASAADYETALRSVTYRNTSTRPDAATRTVTLSVDDGHSVSTATRDITVTPVANAPTLVTTTGALTYTENDAPAVVDAGIGFGDVDTDLFQGATVRITGHHLGGEDVLSFVAPPGVTGITAAWDDSTGTLTLSGTASSSDYEAALREVRYANTSDTPDTHTRTLTFSITDGNTLVTATRDIDVAAVSDAPLLASTAGAPLAYNENGPATAIDTSLTLQDVDTPSFNGATVQITDNYLAGEDVLSFSSQGGITGTWDAASGTLTLSGNASSADYQAALRSVSYRNLSDAPSTATRSVTFSISDDSTISSSARDITVTAVNDAPELTTSSGALAYIENNAATAIDPSLTLSDLDNASFTGATVRISGHYLSSQDVLSFTNQLGITGSWDATTGTLTLSGSASQADYQTALRSVAYSNNSDTPDTTSRTVSFSIGDGTATATATRAVTVSAVDDAPLLSGGGGPVGYTENATALVIVPGLTLSDLDTPTFTGATVRITGHYAMGQDLLGFTAPSGISGITASWDASTGTLTLSGNASSADYQAALRGVTYRNTSDSPETATRTVTFTMDDGQQSTSLMQDITVTAVNDDPVLTIGGAAQAYTENNAATAIAPALTLADADNTVFTGATVRISNHLVAGEDVLSLSTQPGITASWDAATGTLTLSGNASATAYQAALRAVSYANSSDTPDSTPRTVTFQISDGQATATATQTIGVTAVDDTPQLLANSLSVTQGETGVPVIVIADPDTAAGNVIVTASGIAGGHFVNTQTSATVTQFTWQDVQAGLIHFAQDGSATAPTYALSLGDGHTTSGPQSAEVRFTALPVSVPTTTTVKETASESTAPAPAAHAKAEAEPVPALAPSAAPAAPLALAGALPAALPPEPQRVSAFEIDARAAVNTVRAVIEVQARETSVKIDPAAILLPESFQFSWTNALQNVINPEELRRNLDALQGQLQEQGSQHRQVVASSIALSTGLSMGYVIWLVRGGALLGSMLSAMPAWQMIDPLPVLTRGRHRGGEFDGDDDQPVEHLFDGDHDADADLPDPRLLPDGAHAAPAAQESLS